MLAGHLDALIPAHASVLDVGSGDGLLASLVLARRPDLAWSAIDTLARPVSHVPVQLFDGRRLPFGDKQMDVVLFVDVLHHVDDPMVLLREAVRVARSALVIKDHLREGLAANARLRFMDWVGNAGWGVSLPYQYWSESQWQRAREELGLRMEEQSRSLGLYPWWADWLFGGSLHFIARLAVPSAGARESTEVPGSAPRIERWEASLFCPDPVWEEAYRRFETPEEETRKFRRRLLAVGARSWPRDSEIGELFCGRGNGLKALASLGFDRLSGVDLSEDLLRSYRGPARLYLGDCRDLKLPEHSLDVVVVHGGLHHLLDPIGDLERTLVGVRRVLRPRGRLVIVEPWSTPFLSLVHAVSRRSVGRRLWRKLDAFATMVERERDTYFRWLSKPEPILALLRSHFVPEREEISRGKLTFVGSPRPKTPPT
ncbi:MAG: methyltransferase domain-containing protein, partial [Burkholderiales bacterium]